MQKIANIFWDEYKEVSAKENASITFYIKCFDLSSFTSEDISILDEKSIITNPRVKSVEIKFHFEDKRVVHI